MDTSINNIGRTRRRLVLQDRNVAFLRPLLQPLLKAIGNAMQRAPAHRVQVSVGVEKTNDPLRLLKRLDQSVEQDPVEAAIVKANAWKGGGLPGKKRVY